MKKKRKDIETDHVCQRKKEKRLDWIRSRGGKEGKTKKKLRKTEKNK